MFDLTTYSNAELQGATAPLSVEELTTYFDTKEKGERLAFIIDYTRSGLKGKSLMTYLSNLEITASLRVDIDSPREERFDLIHAYMSSRSIVECPVLAATAAQVLAVVQGYAEFHDYLSHPILTPDETVEFVELHTDIVAQWAAMMNSMWVFAAECASDKTVFEEVRPSLVEIDDAYFVGKNFVNLFGLAPFMEIYYSRVPDVMFYFTKQFHDAMFGSKRLATWFIIPSNPLLFFMEGHKDIKQIWHQL